MVVLENLSSTAWNNSYDSLLFWYIMIASRLALKKKSFNLSDVLYAGGI